MKVAKRNTVRRITTRRICSPEFKRISDDQVQFFLPYVDDQAYRRSLVTSKELFAYAAGDNEEGQLPDGLDRLYDHQFVIHVGPDDKAIGLDVIPARAYRGGVVPVKSADVQTVRLEYLLGGMVCVVTQKPHKARPSAIIELLAAMDKLIATGKPITLSSKLPGIGKIQVVEGDAVEVKLSTGRSNAQPVYDLPLDE